MSRVFSAFTALSVVVLAIAAPAHAQACPEGAEQVREERAGKILRIYCRCKPGYVLVGKTCAVSTEKPLELENTRHRDDYQAWLAAVHGTIVRDREVARPWVDDLVLSARNLTLPAITSRDLLAGDVLLLAPDSFVGYMIDLLTGKLAGKAGGAAHALVYLGRTPAGQTFLDHTAFDPGRPERGGGSHIIGETEFRAQYGARQLYAARALAPVDGRRLLTEALQLAARDARPGGWQSFRPTSFLLVGKTEDNAACSVKAMMVVFRATGASAPDVDARLDSLGIRDLSPNAFRDRDGVGKYFVAFPVLK